MGDMTLINFNVIFSSTNSKWMILLWGKLENQGLIKPLDINLNICLQISTYRMSCSVYKRCMRVVRDFYTCHGKSRNQIRSIWLMYIKGL